MSASIIRIKRSQVSGNPSTLANGELAYSALPNNDVNGGDRLYIGIGTETNGNAANHFVIGGKYFTDLTDHTRGILEPDSAILVDSNKKINELFVDNLGFDGNEISSTDSNGDILITPDGTGKTIVTNLFIDDDETSIEDLIKQVSFDNFDIVGTADIGVSEDENVFTISLENTTVTAGTYGSDTQIPVVTVDAKGRITSVTTESIATDLSVAGDTGTGVIELLTDSLSIVSGTNAGISTEVTKAGTIVTTTVSLDQDLSTSGSPTFVNQTLTGDLAVNGGEITTTATTFDLLDDNATTVNAFGDATAISIGANTGTTTFNHNVVVDDDLAVNGGNITTTSATLNLANANATTVNAFESATTISIGANTGTTTINNNVVIDDDLTVNGGDITTDQSTFNLINATATTVNAFGDATSISIGAETGTTAINNDLEVAGDLVVKGTLTSLETTTLEVEDPLVKFGKDNPGDVFSIGFYGEYVDNSITNKTGLFRSHVSKEYFLFDGLTGDITTDNIISTSGLNLAVLNIDDLNANNVVAAGDITGDQINATLFVGEIDGGTY